jgi:ribosomal protein S18 acetylase RimI-like enzyme
MEIIILDSVKHKEYYKKNKENYNNIIKNVPDFPETIKQGTYSLLLLDDKNIAGVARVDFGNPKKFSIKCFAIRNVFVFPEYRGKKLCNIIMSAIAKQQKTDNYNFLPTFLLVNKTNIKAIKCYLSNGFVTDGFLEGYMKMILK